MAPPKSIINNNGSIRIRFRHEGTQFDVTKLGRFDDPVAIRYAKKVMNKISRDIRNKSFICKDNNELMLIYNPSTEQRLLKLKKTESLVKETGEEELRNLIIEILSQSIQNIDLSKSLVIEQEKKDLCKIAIETLDKSNQSLEKCVCRHLKAYGKRISNLEEAKSFINWLKVEYNLKNSSIARYVDVLRKVDSLFKDIRIEKQNKPNERAFTREEVITICEWFEKTQYYAYVRFLFLTGCRISEAIGLRWKHIDFNQKIIYFYETLARSNNSSSKRVVKTTKKNIMRQFPINDSLLELFNKLEIGEPDELIFMFNGHYIDDRKFRSRYWKRCLEECGISYRKPSSTRHTFISHFLEQTKDAIKCASLTHGSKRGAETIFQHYASIINKIEVPNMY